MVQSDLARLPCDFGRYSGLFAVHCGRTYPQPHAIVSARRTHVDRRRQPRLTIRCQIVGANSKLTTWGCGRFLGLVYAASPRLARYSTGLR